MSAWYREITPLQEPMDMGLDPTGNRARVGFNVFAIKGASDTFIEELVKLLTDAGVGTFGTNIFASTSAEIPVGAGPYLSIVETGGTSPERTQNSVAVPAYQRPTAQLVVRASTYSAARTMARAAYNALVGVRNQTVTA